mmetsp:Transcript_2187/g.7188  ORF Transcript_2187/g.7188 Transcript_2187/m.7188 type:complete len:228 (+) Transcript_2187:913-1596(+)
MGRGRPRHPARREHLGQVGPLVDVGREERQQQQLGLDGYLPQHAHREVGHAAAATVINVPSGWRWRGETICQQRVHDDARGEDVCRVAPARPAGHLWWRVAGGAEELAVLSRVGDRASVAKITQHQARRVPALSDSRGSLVRPRVTTEQVLELDVAVDDLVSTKVAKGGAELPKHSTNRALRKGAVPLQKLLAVTAGRQLEEQADRRAARKPAEPARDVRVAAQLPQ